MLDLKKIATLLVPLAAGGAALAGSGEWTPAAGISGGMIEDLEYVEAGVALAVTPYAVYRTTDHGANWTRIRSLSSTSVHSRIAVNPANKNQVLISGDFLVRSTNGGQEFTSVSLGGTFGGTAGAVAFSHDGTYAFLAATNTGDLWRSTDGGANWTRFVGVLPAASASELDADAFDRDTLYANANAQNYVSRNGGTSWSPIGAPAYYFDLRASRSVTGRLLSLDTGRLAPSVSADFGATWTPLSAPADLRFFGTAPG